MSESPSDRAMTVRCRTTDVPDRFAAARRGRAGGSSLRDCSPSCCTQDGRFVRSALLKSENARLLAPPPWRQKVAAEETENAAEICIWKSGLSSMVALGVMFLRFEAIPH